MFVTPPRMDIATFSSLPITLASGHEALPIKDKCADTVEDVLVDKLWDAPRYSQRSGTGVRKQTYCAHYWDASTHVQLPITRSLMGWWNGLIAHV